MSASTPVERSESAEPDGRAVPASLRRHPVAQGVGGGVAATVVMTVYRLPAFRALPPTAEFWATYVGDEGAEEYAGVGMALHVLYGAAGGGVFGLAFARLGRLSGSRRRWGGVFLGVAYGLLLSVVGTRLVLRRLLDETLDDDEAFVFVVGHVVYGVALGTWMVVRRGFGDVYD